MAGYPDRRRSSISTQLGLQRLPRQLEVTFALLDDDDKTRLKLTHTCLASFPDDPHFARKRFEDRWKNIFGSNLKSHLKILHLLFNNHPITKPITTATTITTQFPLVSFPWFPVGTYN